MYICICKGLTEKKVKEVISDGADHVREVQRRCQAGKSCGSCINKVQNLIESHNDS